MLISLSNPSKCPESLPTFTSNFFTNKKIDQVQDSIQLKKKSFPQKTKPQIAPQDPKLIFRQFSKNSANHSARYRNRAIAKSIDLNKHQYNVRVLESDTKKPLITGYDEPLLGFSVFKDLNEVRTNMATPEFSSRRCAKNESKNDLIQLKKTNASMSHNFRAKKDKRSLVDISEIKVVNQKNPFNLPIIVKHNSRFNSRRNQRVEGTKVGNYSLNSSVEFDIQTLSISPVSANHYLHHPLSILKKLESLLNPPPNSLIQ